MRNKKKKKKKEIQIKGDCIEYTDTSKLLW